MQKLINAFLLMFVSVNGIAQVHIGQGESFATIEKAHYASAILPGDTVYLHEGLYKGYQGISSLKGDSLNWIVITSYQEDQTDKKNDVTAKNIN
ncbi:MAG: hypothetical protein PF588_09540 [Candidatus Kapabacteria bacterium]|jgi:hypothetical protein|nr:hypothetical protein [Candidatus Kapabacteria bacterium]